MRVKFDAIPEEGLRLEIHDESWFPDSELRREGAVAASVFLKKKGERVLAEGCLKTKLILACDRCLASYDFPLHADFKLDIEMAGKGMMESLGREHLCGANEMDVMFLDEPVVDVFYVLQQQVFLAIPAKKICSEACKGLCSQCGANLNQKQCGCAANLKASPFDVLKSLKR